MPTRSREETREPDTSLGVRIREERNGRSLSLDDLSALTGISKPQLSRIETGDRRPSVGALMQIAKALGTDAGQLLAEDLVRSQQRRPSRWVPVIGEVDVQPAGGVDGGTMSSYFLEIATAGLRGETVAFPGEGSLLGLLGTMVVGEGRRERVVGEGEVLHFRTERAFALANRGRRLARALLVITRRPSGH